MTAPQARRISTIVLLITGNLFCRVFGQTTLPAISASDARLLAAGGNDTGFDMAPETRIEVVNAAVEAIQVKLPPGPFMPTWDSLKENYKVPQWFYDAKFGIFMHWG